MTEKKIRVYLQWHICSRSGHLANSEGAKIFWPPILVVGSSQEAKYVERSPNTTSAWAGWSRFDIPVDRYGGVHSLLICTSSILGSPTCHRASQQENTYSTKYQKADRASTLVTLWVHPIAALAPHWARVSNKTEFHEGLCRSRGSVLLLLVVSILL